MNTPNTPIPHYVIDDYRELGFELGEAHHHVMRSGQYIRGEQVARFEEEWAAYCGAQHCVGVGNGLDALTLTLRAWGIGPGDEVIVPANTYIATWLAVSHVGATPVPVEPGMRSYNMDVNLVDRAITPRTRAIIAVHLYGQQADMWALRELANQHGLYLLCDSAQGHGLVHDADATAYSFYPTKNLGCFGDGGAVVTNDVTWANHIRIQANYGAQSKYFNVMQGYNSRLDELQAAYLRVKLPHLDKWNLRRMAIADWYRAALLGSSHAVPPNYFACDVHVFHQYVIRCEHRDALQQWLADDGIGTLVHYPRPPHRQPMYAHLHNAELPLTQRLAETILSLPMWPNMPREHVERVARRIHAFKAPKSYGLPVTMTQCMKCGWAPITGVPHECTPPWGPYPLPGERI